MVKLLGYLLLINLTLSFNLVRGVNCLLSSAPCPSRPRRAVNRRKRVVKTVRLVSTVRLRFLPPAKHVDHSAKVLIFLNWNEGMVSSTFEESAKFSGYVVAANEM